MKSLWNNYTKFFVFLAFGLFLFWLVYKDMELDTLMNELKTINYWWIALAAFFSILSHISRAIRWNMLIEPLGYKPRTANTFFAVLVMYITNLAVPRSGEVARCAVLKKYEKVPFSQLIGTVIIERTADLIFLVILLFLLIITQFGIVYQFVYNNPEVKEKLSVLVSYGWILTLSFIGGVFFLWVLYNQRHHVRRFSIYARFKELVLNLKEGIITIANMKNKWKFIGHTIFIWLMYFLMTYVVFFTYAPTAHLSMAAGLAVLVMGGFGMVAPVQGGIGAWHFMARETLFIYGIARPYGLVFAFISHTSMTLFLIAFGVFAFAALPVYNRKYLTDQPTTL